jgi:hypothetical protein
MNANTIMFDDDHPNVIATILRVGKGRALVPAKPLGTAPGYRYKCAARWHFPTSNR